MNKLMRLAAGFAVGLAALAASAAELVIVQVAPFSGPLASTGKHVQAGAQLYFDKINARGGVNGAKIKLVSADDGYKAAQTLQLVRQLVAQHKPVALFGLVGTGNVSALLKEKVLDAEGIPAVGIRTGASSLITPPHPYLFIGRVSYATEVDKILRQMAAMGMKRIGVFYQDDAFGLDGLSAAEAAVANHGMTLVAKGAYEKNTTKVEPAVKAIAAANPQGVVMVSNTAASSAFVKAFREQGGSSMLVALSTTDGPEVVNVIGKEAAHGLGIVQIVPDPTDRGMGVVRELQDLYKKAAPAGVELNHTMLQGYIGAKLLVEGLRRAGDNPSRKSLRDAMESIHNFDLGGIYASFSATSHTGVEYADITVIDREGRLLR